MPITVLPVLEDNYTYIVQDGESVAVIDPAEAGPVLQILAASHLRLTHILVTHHHYDHVQGIPELKRQTRAEVYAADAARIPDVDHVVHEGSAIALGQGTFTVIETPGHGDRDCSYLWTAPGAQPALFCGDTLFVSGCGRVLEGSIDSLWHSLQRLAALPDDTLVYCGHEYTEDNLRFAVAMYPDDPIYRERLSAIERCLATGRPSVPSHIGEEKRANPFLRCTSSAQFAELRNKKNRFRV